MKTESEIYFQVISVKAKAASPPPSGKGSATTLFFILLRAGLMCVRENTFLHWLCVQLRSDNDRSEEYRTKAVTSGFSTAPGAFPWLTDTKPFPGLFIGNDPFFCLVIIISRGLGLFRYSGRSFSFHKDYSLIRLTPFSTSFRNGYCSASGSSVADTTSCIYGNI